LFEPVIIMFVALSVEDKISETDVLLIELCFVTHFLEWIPLLNLLHSIVSNRRLQLSCNVYGS
jgi:hypothetical protein